MNFLSALKSEIVYPTATIIIPGATASVFYIFVLAHYYPELIEFATKDSGYAALASFLFALTVGLIMESISSYLEAYPIAWMLQRNNSDHWDEWYRYLRCTLPPELIAQRYIRTMLLHLKFELSMGTAVLFALPGLIWLQTVKGIVTCRPLVLLVMALIALVGFLLYDAYKTAAVLDRVRTEILKGIGLPDKINTTK